MKIIKEIIEQYNYKKINFSMWRKGDMTLQGTSTNDGGDLLNKILTSRSAYKACYKGKFLCIIETKLDLQFLDFYVQYMKDKEENKLAIYGIDSFDVYIHSFGFSFPRNEKELAIFREIQKDFPSKYIEKDMSQEEALAILNDDSHEDILGEDDDQDNEGAAAKFDKITFDQYDSFIHSIGVLPPRTVKELRRFEELYKDFPHERIKDISIEDARALFEDDINEENQ